MEANPAAPPLLTDKVEGDLGGSASGLAPRRRPESLPPVGAGLVNLGNTCFLNSVLQCVTHTVPLLQSLRLSAHPYPCSRRRGEGTGDNSGFCSLCALRQHIDLCMRERDKVVEPSGFVNNLSDISSSFSRYQQEDAHEFLNCLLDNLDNHCLDPHPGVNDSTQKDSLIKEIFGGRLRSQVQCCECGHQSDTYEPLLDLSLEIEDADSLEDALESFTKVEKIEDPEIKFTCEGCKAHVSVQKQLTLDQAPLVIALHLKRFKSNGYVADKIDKFLKYPVNLDLKPFHSNPALVGDLKYELYAAVMHQGASPLYGHYYCFVRPSPGLWYIMDDHKVYPVNEENALNESAYILFYMKQGAPWFSSLLEEEKEDRNLDADSTTSPVSVVDHLEAYQTSSSESEDNCHNSIQTLRADKNLILCGDANSDADKRAAQNDNVPCPPEASECPEPKIEGNHASSVPRLSDACVEADLNEVGASDGTCVPASSDGTCVPTASQCNIRGVERNQCEVLVTNCVTASQFRPTLSSNSDIRGAEAECTIPSDGTSMCNTPQNEGILAADADDGCKTRTPCTPKQLSMDMFYDEPWEEEEKENYPKLHFNSAPTKPTTKANGRRLAFLDSYVRTMPKCRRLGFVELIHPGRCQRNAGHQKKRKLHLDSENSPCRSPSAMRASSNRLPSSVLRQLVVQDDSQPILAIDSHQRGKRK